MGSHGVGSYARSATRPRRIVSTCGRRLPTAICQLQTPNSNLKPQCLAGNLPPHLGAGPRSPVDHNLRELQKNGRAASGQAERTGPGRAGSGTSWVNRQGAACRHRGSAKGGKAACSRRHIQSRARNRHGCRRSGDSGRVAGSRGARHPADRPGGTFRGRTLGRHNTSDPSGRSARKRHGR